ncbi:MAG: alpha-amylase [Prevotella sp.]|nr:alpha-amylase [Prevotella sp.]
MIAIYQVLPRLFGNRTANNVQGGQLSECGSGKFSDFSTAVLDHIREMGFTHVWYTGVIRHATQTDYTAHGIPRQSPDVVKGVAGSPYAIADYYDVDPDLATDIAGRMGEWEALIERTHRAGLKVVMDFVPNHVAREYRSVCLPEGTKDLSDENFYLLDGEVRIGNYAEKPARATGNNVFSCQPSTGDWYETVKLNYDHHDTWDKMTAILLFWSQKGVDAFRCDMAEMVPSSFWRYATAAVRKAFPDIDFIGEVYNPFLYREYIASGFTYLYDKVGMYDCLRDVVCKRRPASDITCQWQATDDIRQHMLYFLENHDEQRIASDFFAGDGRKGVPAAIISVLMQTNPFMLYMGQEYGERGMDAEGFSGKDGRTTIFDYWTVGSLLRGLYDRSQLSEEERSLEQTYSLLLNIAQKEPAAREGTFFDLMYVNLDSQTFDASRQYAFLRKSGNEMLLVVANFSDSEVRCGINIPQHAFDYLGIAQPHGDTPIEVEATDLLSQEKTVLRLSPIQPVEAVVPAHGGRVYKVVL